MTLCRGVRAWVAKGRGTKGAATMATRGIGSRQGTRRDGSVAAGAIGRTGETGQSPIESLKATNQEEGCPMEYSHKLARSTTDTLEKLVAFIEERRRSDSLSAEWQSSRRTCARCAPPWSARRPRRSWLASTCTHLRPCRWGSAVSSCVASASTLPPPAPSAIERNLYADRSGGGRALCPLERRAGVIRGYWTPARPSWRHG